MPPFYRLIIACLILLNIYADLYNTQPKPPRLTVILIIDQFAYGYLPKLEPHLHWGLKHLMRNGISFINAHHPHALPETATGHATLSTGAYPGDHGYIANSWFDHNGNPIGCDDDPYFPIFIHDNKLSTQGKSARNLMVDTLSDQCILASQSAAINQVFALSLKNRAAIPAAGKLGKALWFDDTTGLFTSSKAYFDRLPDWIMKFNEEKRVEKLRREPWKRFFKIKSPAYDLKLISDYSSSEPKSGIIQRAYSATNNEPQTYAQFRLTPQANQALFDLAIECINANLSANSNDKMILWLSLSPLDYVGHLYGPNSLEAVDMIYHLDRQLHKFMQSLSSKVKKSDTLLILTADHGIEPMPELMKKQGYWAAHRIMAQPLVDGLTKIVAEQGALEKPIINFTPSQFYFDSTTLNTLNKQESKQALMACKSFLNQQPGIKNVWTYQELMNQQFEPNQLEQLFKRQLYPGRSGHLICQTFPYCSMTTYKNGTDHSSPYNYNTHVPLIFYQKKVWEKQTIPDLVTTAQFAGTLAYILQVPKPSASTVELLPGIATLRPSELTYA